MRWFVALSLGACFCCASVVAADPVTVDYDFAAPELVSVKINGSAYTRVVMPETSNGGEIGNPALPAAGARILLPCGASVETIEVIAGERVSLGAGYVVEPVGQPFPLSQGPESVPAPSPDPDVYAAATPFPAARGELAGTHSFRGYQVAHVRLQPVEYVPATGELAYFPHMRVVVHTFQDGRVADSYRGLALDAAELARKVDNPAAVRDYPLNPRAGRNFDLLILTTPTLAPSFQPLKAYHDANGVTTEIRTTTDAGGSDPLTIRNYITSVYQNDGISYVIIGGDDDVIPARDLYVRAYAGGETEYDMPGDIYFACLDGTWNYDGDSYWGEPTDGPGGGDVDLVADVYVGRASAGNTTEADRFVTKTLWYHNGGHSLPQDVLIVGEYLGFGGVSEYAKNTLNQLIDGGTFDGYTTVGIPSGIYTIDTMYEADGSWSKAQLMNEIDAGVHILNHLGHGSPDYAMKLYNPDVMNLVNTELCFVYSQTCLAGHLDGTDCWAETANVKTDYGAFAVIMNARYGWGSSNSTDGPSHRFNREFWDAVYGEGLTQLAPANHDSKEDNLYRISDPCMRWCTYELNLFGDPTIGVRGVSGLSVTPPDGLVAEGPNGGPFTPSSEDYVLTNLGDYAIDYSVTCPASWITVTNGSGTLAAGGNATVTVSINASANTLPDGRHEAVVDFINTTDHLGDTIRDVELNVGIPLVVHDWTFDTNPGWTTQGQWAFGQPSGGGGSYGGPDPTSGHTGANVYGYNLSGDYTNNMPEYHLTSNAIDCTGLSACTLKFWRWLGVEQPAYDHAYVRVSNDGVNWTTVWENSNEVTDSSWTQQEIDIAAIADGEPTVYLRWTMGTTDVGWTYCGWNIDDVQIVALGGTPPALHLLMPNGTPEYVAPGAPTTFEVQIVDGGETYAAGTGMLKVRAGAGDPFVDVPLTHVNGNMYEATIPGMLCDAAPEFYLYAEGDGGTSVTYPNDAPNHVMASTVGVVTTLMWDDFETDQGWTVGDIGDDATTGIWNRADPNGTDAQPEDDHTPAPGVACYVTDSRGGSLGDWDVDGGKTTLKSPVFDLSQAGSATIGYWRWYSNDTGGAPNEDVFKVDISSDGGNTWTNVETVGPTGGQCSGGWYPYEFSVADVITPTAQMQMRFVASDEYSGSLVEAAVDDFQIVVFSCDFTTSPGDLNCDGALNAADIDPFVLALTDPAGYAAAYPDCEVMNADVNEDGSINAGDIDPFVMLLTGP